MITGYLAPASQWRSHETGRCLFQSILAILLTAAFPSLSFSQDAEFTLLLRGGMVLDGTGADARRADVALQGDRVAAIGVLANVRAARVIDVTGKTVIPGIIDLHSHADGPGEGQGLRAKDPRRRAALNLVTQGVTTVVVNQDGRSPLDIARQKARLEELGFGPNAVLMVGHNSIRRAVMAQTSVERPATEDEIGAMVQLLQEGMEAGAWGLSAGLEYEPGIWSATAELIALVKTIVPHGGVYIVHERSSGNDPFWYVPSQHESVPPTMLDSILETIGIGEETGATVVATHIKARGVNYWGSSAAIIEVIENARARGVKIYADQYPYTSSGSDGAIVLLPKWILDEFKPAHRKGAFSYADTLRRALNDSEAAAKIRGDVLHKIARRGGPGQIVVFEYPRPKYIGKTLELLALQHEITPLEMVFRLQFEGYTNRFGGARLRGYSMSEKDIEAFAARPWVATASDAGIALPQDAPVHARSYGTFPRKIHFYAKGRGVLTVPEAVRSMTGLPAEILQFNDRGQLKVGFFADLAVIDMEALEDTATFFRPHQYAKGVEYVLVNGEFAVDEGKATGNLPGRVLTPATSQRKS